MTVIFENARFNGPAYEPLFDDSRLRGQIRDIFLLMKDSTWRTLGEIEDATGHGQSSISAQLRHLRKARHGSHVVNRRARGDRANGLYEYQLIVNDHRSNYICGFDPISSDAKPSRMDLFGKPI